MTFILNVISCHLNNAYYFTEKKFITFTYNLLSHMLIFPVTFNQKKKQMVATWRCLKSSLRQQELWHSLQCQHPTGSTSEPFPVDEPEKVVEDITSRWIPAPMWKTQKKLLAFSRASSSHYGYLENESEGGEHSIFSLCNSVFHINNK